MAPVYPVNSCVICAVHIYINGRVTTFDDLCLYNIPIVRRRHAVVQLSSCGGGSFRVQTGRYHNNQDAQLHPLGIYKVKAKRRWRGEKTGVATDGRRIRGPLEIHWGDWISIVLFDSEPKVDAERVWSENGFDAALANDVAACPIRNATSWGEYMYPLRGMVALQCAPATISARRPCHYVGDKRSLQCVVLWWLRCVYTSRTEPSLGIPWHWGLRFVSLIRLSIGMACHCDTTQIAANWCLRDIVIPYLHRHIKLGRKSSGNAFAADIYG